MANARTSPFNSRTFLTKVGNGKTLLKVQKKQILFSQGDASDAFFYILEGKVKLTVVSQKGKEAVVGVLAKEDFFGEACLTGQLIRTATATSLDNSTIVRIEKAAMVRVLHDEPLFSELFMS